MSKKLFWKQDRQPLLDIKDRSDVYKCFSKWQEHGLFENILNYLATEADFQDVSIVSTIIKVNKDAGS